MLSHNNPVNASAENCYTYSSRCPGCCNEYLKNMLFVLFPGSTPTQVQDVTTDSQSTGDSFQLHSPLHASKNTEEC